MVRPPDGPRSGALSATRIRAVLVVAVVATLLVLPPVGRRLIATGGINGDDEARYPLMARDMLARGAWFDIQVRGERTWEKPPLLPWMIAAFARIRGSVTEGTAHLPAALATIVTVIATFLLADALFTRRAGLWGALILITSYDFYANSQQVLPDMLVVGFSTLAAWCFWQAVSVPSRGRWGWVAFYGAIALAVFAKGPLGLVALLSVAIWLWTEHGAVGTVRHLWQPAGLGLFALITLAWLGPFFALGPRSFWQHTIWGDWLTWYFGLPNDAHDLVYTVVLGFLPWTLVGALALAHGIRAWNAPAVRFALLWFAVPFAVLLLSAHQKHRYALSMYPGAALMVAWWADAHGTNRTFVERVVGWVAVGGGAAIAVALRMPQWWDPQMQLYVSGASWRLLLPVFAGLAVIAIAFCWGLCAGRPAFLVYGGVAGMVIILGYGIWPFNQRYNEVWNFKALASRMDAYAQHGMPAIFKHRPDWLAIDFYAGRSPHSIDTIEEFNAYLARPQHPVVVVDEKGWRNYGAQLAPMPRVLEQMAIGKETLMIVRADDGIPRDQVPRR